jgi:predicted dehydrogenase
MQRSWPEFRQAVELVRNGYIGEIKTVKVNIAGPPKGFDLTAENIPEGLDWQFWLGPNTTERPYNKMLAPTIEFESTMWPQWRAYKDFGGGGITDWGAHMFDIAQWGLDMDHSGPVKILYPSVEHAAQAGLVFEYANGVSMIHTNTKEKPSCTFIGTEGEVYVARGELKTTPNESLKSKLIGEQEKHVYKSTNHYQDFLDAIKKRSKPICDVEIGHRTASVCNIGNIAYELKSSLTWDPEREKFIGNKQANKLLDRPMKREWKV